MKMVSHRTALKVRLNPILRSIFGMEIYSKVESNGEFKYGIRRL